MQELANHQTGTPHEQQSLRRFGMEPKAIVERPSPLFSDWIEPTSFSESLTLHMRRHGDTCWHLCRAIVRPGERFSRATLNLWVSGIRLPRSVTSLEMLSRIERRYALPAGHFTSLLTHRARATGGHKLNGVKSAERRRLAWHLPVDFDQRSPSEQKEILSWVRSNIITGSTDYRRYQADAAKQPFALRFPALTGRKTRSTSKPAALDGDLGSDAAPSVAPAALEAELRALLHFKSATLTPLGFNRSGVWGAATSEQRIEHFALLFGALTAPPASFTRGLGIPAEKLSFALLVLPNVWDWYIQWRERRRGFYTRWEADMLRLALALTKAETGWLRQHPALADRLCEIPGLLTSGDLETIKANWAGACEAMYRHAAARAKEIERVARVHRDPFEPILPILEADSPLSEYRRITEEIARRIPEADRYPLAAAETTRAFLMVRLALHLGLRQRNMRELLLCKRGDSPRTERQLEQQKRGELRWTSKACGWEVFIPAAAFKNATSSFFSGRPFRLVLPDLGELYRHLEAYIDTHRAVLLKGAKEPGTLFVKSAKASTKDAAYDQNTFYEAWRQTIQRYGIWNPYTKRGAIPGLLPHGPHNIRDVIATHILKETGSFEQASYAIQDTPEMVAKHYGRFLPQDKAALAAGVLNQVWAA